MGVCSYQPLAMSKGAHCEVESEGSWRQSSDPRNTNIIRHIRLDEFAKQNEVQKLHGDRSVNNAGTWNEGYLSYHGRSHRREETKYESLRQYITGWVNYFKLADIKSLLLQVDEWYRRRLRMIIWKQWKRVRTRLRNLIMLGIAKFKAREYANTRKSYWHTANSPIPTRTITNDRLQKAGYIFFSDYYRKVHA